MPAPAVGSAIRRTKIVATLGPAWDQPERMALLFDAGVDTVRINASHGTAELRLEWIERLKQVRAARQLPTGILVDLHGPRIRVGKLSDPVMLTQGQQVTFAPEAVAQEGEIPTTYPELAGDVSAGSRIQPRSWKAINCFSPSPSMSKARRLTKCFRCSMRWNGQASSPVQRRTTDSTPEALVSFTSGVFSGQTQTCGNS